LSFTNIPSRWNDKLRPSQRKREFNVPELKRLAAAAVNRPTEDAVGFKKLSEGGFNRTFLVSMRGGFELVARIPYLSTEPRHLLVASEMATMDYLRTCGIPVPEVYGYSTTSENSTGTEYIFMELMSRMKLGDTYGMISRRMRDSRS
jgi:aminoglycoside phosphotransferase (APT) family kinase protein